MQDLGHWLLDEKLTQLGELPFGFVYIITNNISNRKYIGKKQCITTKKKASFKRQKK